MHRKDWMPPREESIGRSLTPQPTGRTAEGRRKTKGAMTLLACAAALTLLLGAVLLSAGDGNETAQPEIPARSLAPPVPYVIVGYTYDSDGVTPLPACDVTITDVTSAAVWTTTSGGDGKYTYVIEAAEGDLIRAEAEKDTLYGMTEDVAAGGLLQLDITLLPIGIPEFPMVLAPVLGVLALFTVAGIRRRRSVQP